MGTSIAVMNTKGGVGKSTVVMALAETLADAHAKTVLVIDADAQTSLSSMLMSTSDLHALQSHGTTLVEYLIASVLGDREAEEPVDWRRYVVRDLSDIDGLASLYAMAGDVRLTLFEREINSEARRLRLRSQIAHLLSATEQTFDIVLIDCPPGLSVLTECWLREAKWHITPTKVDYTSICALDVFRRFKAMNPEMGFADNLGVLVNMKEPLALSDREYEGMLRADVDNRCFETTIPRLNALQAAARCQTESRSFSAKYPGDAGHVVKALADEVVARLATAESILDVGRPPGA